MTKVELLVEGEQEELVELAQEQNALLRQINSLLRTGVPLPGSDAAALPELRKRIAVLGGVLSSLSGVLNRPKT